MAAALVVTAGALWLMYQFSGFRQIKIEASERTETTLPDGTHVWINTGSVLVYEHPSSGDSRRVTLEGEAYFEVAKNKDRPRFVIHTGQATTTVTGTAFNLRNIADENFIELSVASGTVLFGNTKSALVGAGMQAVFNKQTGVATTGPMPGANTAAWKDRKLAFTNVPLTKVLQDIARYFQINLELEMPAAAACHITGEFNDPQLENVLRVIELTLGGSHRVENNTYHINVQPCEP